MYQLTFLLVLKSHAPVPLKGDSLTRLFSVSGVSTVQILRGAGSSSGQQISSGPQTSGAAPPPPPSAVHCPPYRNRNRYNKYIDRYGTINT